MSKVQKVIYIDDVESKHLNKKKKTAAHYLFIYVACHGVGEISLQSDVCCRMAFWIQDDTKLQDFCSSVLPCNNS